MSTLSISVSCWDYDRVRALIDGRVTVNDCSLRFVTLPPEASFHRAWGNQEFDVTELGLCTYLTALSRGNCPYVAIPVFISRAFRHSAIYVRNDRGIDQASDLRGKKIGVPFYEMAAAVWVRGFLKDDYGVAADDIFWHQGGLNEPGQRPRAQLNLPDGFPLAQIAPDETLSAMLADGELDGIVTARPPACFDLVHPQVRRLFPDYRQVEIDCFRRTSIFPIMHVIGIRKTLASRHPKLARDIYTAFKRAKQIADEDLHEVTALKIGLPWVAAETDATEAIMGRDFWPYGVESSRSTLEAASRYSHEQGLTVRPIALDEMFVEVERDG